MAFERVFHVGWGHLDSNAHMANTAYLDLAVDIRMMFFSGHGFPVEEFARRRVGPVVKTDRLEYFRELHLLEPVTVTHESSGVAPDGSRFRLRNTFLRDDGAVAARLESEGGWLDLAARKLIVPPEDLLAVLQRMPKSEDFEEMRSIAPSR